MSDWNIPQKYLDQSKEIERLQAELEELKHDIARSTEHNADVVTENERLREALKSLKRSAQGQDDGWIIDACEEALKGGDILETVSNSIAKDKEIERLREALELIASCEKRVDGDVVDIARKALKQ